MQAVNETNRPLTRENLCDVFRRAESQRREPLIGLEHEKVSFRLKDGGPVPYAGKSGIHAFLMQMSARYGWEPLHVEGWLLALKRGKAHITLEPGGQIELSGSPLPNLALVKQELQLHIDEVVDVGQSLGIGMSVLGSHPSRDPLSIDFIPKPRYGFMRRYFQQSGSRGVWMMGNTATVQVNLDFANEAEAMEKMRAGQLASPYVTAIFANSPFELGRHTGWKSRRYFTWLDVDSARCGLLPFLYQPHASYEAYAQWAILAPLFGIHRDHTFMPAAGVPFITFLRDGFAGHQPKEEDWYDHLGTLYPEVRLKRTIELRGADSGGIEHSIGVAAIWRGLLDDPASRRRVIGLLDVPKHPAAFQREVAQHGLMAHTSDPDLLARCVELTHIARQGLFALNDPLAASVLEPVFAALSEGLSPADEWPASAHISTHDLLMQTRYR